MRFFFIIYILISFNPCTSVCLAQDLEKLKASDTIYLVLYSNPDIANHSLDSIVLKVSELGLSKTYYIENKKLRGQHTLFYTRIEEKCTEVDKNSFLSKNKEIIITPDFIDKNGLLKVFYYTLSLDKGKKMYYIIEAGDLDKDRIKLIRVDMKGLVGWMRM